MKIRKQMYVVLMTVIFALGLWGCSGETAQEQNSTEKSKTESSLQKQKKVTGDKLPDYSGEMTVPVNNNKPNFTSKDLTTKSYESYSLLDEEGRCQVAEACVGKDIMPTEKRGAIGMVKPTGWHTVKYENVDGKYLYNRCHLIAYQLTGENANKKNLITGTRSFNVDGMLPYEEMVGDYVRETGNHVLYRVTPVFDGDDLVAKGVQMEAMSVEDKGEDIEFNVFVYNVQDGIEIDYATGDSQKASDSTTKISQKSSTEATVIRGNKRSKVYHCPGQRDYEKMADSKYLVIFHSEKEAKEAGYHRAQR